jgi:hypothetical protein
MDPTGEGENRMQPVTDHQPCRHCQGWCHVGMVVAGLAREEGVAEDAAERQQRKCDGYCRPDGADDAPPTLLIRVSSGG